MTSQMGKGSVRLRAGLTGLVAAAGIALVIPAGASAANIDCTGNVSPAPDSNGKAFDYSFICGSPEGDATQVDGYSIISNKDVAGFSTEVGVINTDTGTSYNDQSFACEGSIPSDGFGCFGKAGLYKSRIESGFSLIRDPCSNKSLRKGNWKVWVVASAPKINPNTGKATPAVSEPLRLRVPVCEGAGTPEKGSKG